MSSPSEHLLIAWYGDDFTGSAAVLEVLAFAGVNAMLFLDVPTEDELSRHPHLEAIGIASTARAQSPEWMNGHLPSVFSALLELNPKLLHYKICSTLDSSPETGSIGRAIEIASDLINPDAVPVLVAAPQMRRYQMFGHLFAGLGEQVYRLDRHPVMARHPVTPMAESDVARHLSLQSPRLDISLWSLEDIAAKRSPTIADSDAISVFTIDCADADDEIAIGRQLWDGQLNNRFVVGSQGIEYALVQHWNDTGELAVQAPPSGVGRSHGMVSVSGSVSPVTAEQIAWSRDNGFVTIRFDVMQACGTDDALENEITRVVEKSLCALDANKDPLIFTAQGPDDPAVEKLRKSANAADMKMAYVNQRIGSALGRLLDRILKQSGARRVVVSGGDTSGYVTAQLGIYALSALAPTIAGASLSRVHAQGTMDGLQLALKGGQMGSPDYFGWIRDGGGLR